MYHYATCGLDNIWLANGYTIKDTKYGRAVAIDDLEGLHQLLARNIIENRARLSSKEFKFLRKELDLSQEALANMLGNQAQTVSLWERGEEVPPMADRFIRVLYNEVVDGDGKLRKTVARLAELSSEIQGSKLVLKESEAGWELAA